MNRSEEIDAQLQALLHAQDDLLRWRPILMTSILDMLRPSRVLAAIRSVDPNSFLGKAKKSTLKKSNRQVRNPRDTAALTAVRRMLKKTRVKMGFPAELPVSSGKKSENGSSGKPTDEQLERFRVEHCIPWLKKNSGYPRREQLIDPSWDLHPFPPKPTRPTHATVVTEPKEETESRSKIRTESQISNGHESLARVENASPRRADSPSRKAGRPTPTEKEAASEAQMWERMSAEAKAHGTRGVPDQVDIQRLPEFCGPAVPLVGATDQVKEQYMKDKHAALESYIQNLKSQGFEFLESYTGYGLPKVRHSSDSR